MRGVAASRAICIDPLHPGITTFEIEIEIEIEFMGGRGRFEGATCIAMLRGEGEAVSADGSFIGETGTIPGWISIPLDNDDDSDSD